MKPGDLLRIESQEYSVGQFLGKGVMGQVHAIEGMDDDIIWVVKTPVAVTEKNFKDLENEYDVMQKLSDGRQLPFVPRVRTGETSDGEFALIMEAVNDRQQLVQWIQNEINRVDQLLGEDAVWAIALDYLQLTQTVHAQLGVSVTDRKVADLRYLPTSDEHHPRLVVIDWGLQSSELQLETDLIIFGQLFYQMITQRIIGVRDTDSLQLNSPRWGDALSVGGRKIITRAISRNYASLNDIRNDITEWRERLQQANRNQLLAIIENNGKPDTEQALEKRLINLDLLRRVAPEVGKQMFDEFIADFFKQQESDLEAIRRQAQDRLADAQKAIENTLEIWQKNHPSFLSVLERWKLDIQELITLEHDERNALGNKVFLDYRKAITATRDVIENARFAKQKNNGFDDVLPLLQAQQGRLQSILNQMPSSEDAPKSHRLIRKLALELDALIFLLQSEQALGQGKFENAYMALDAVRGLEENVEPETLNHDLMNATHQRIRELENAQVLNTRETDALSKIRHLVENGDYETAIKAYQVQSLVPVSAFVQSIGSETITPAYLAVNLNQGNWSSQSWIILLDNLEKYMRTGKASQTFVRYVKSHLDNPYQYFTELSSHKLADDESKALIIGNLLLTIDCHCDQIMGENASS